MEQNEILKQIQQELLEIKRIIKPPPFQNPATDKWIPLPLVRQFLNYAPTQMASLIRSGELVTAVVGKRKFISRKSFEEFLENHSSCQKKSNGQ